MTAIDFAISVTLGYFIFIRFGTCSSGQSSVSSMLISLIIFLPIFPKHLSLPQYIQDTGNRNYTHAKQSYIIFLSNCFDEVVVESPNHLLSL